MNKEQAIKFLKEKRGFDIEDLSKVKYRVYDEDYSMYFKTDKELLEWAKEQYEEYKKEELTDES